MNPRRRIFTLGVAGRLKVFLRLVRDPRTPVFGKLLVVGCAAAYALMPIDIVPDLLPGVGLIDDLIIIPLILSMLTWLAPTFVRREIVEEVLRERRGEHHPQP